MLLDSPASDKVAVVMQSVRRHGHQRYRRQTGASETLEVMESMEASEE